MNSVTNSIPQRSKELVAEAKNFFAGLNSSTVTLREIVNTEPSPAEDYFVETELIFEPASLSECWLTLWFTDCGSIAFGIENTGRLRARLRGLSHWSYAPPFIGGRQPTSLSKEHMLATLRSVAAADVTLVAWTFSGEIIGTLLKVSGRDCSIGGRVMARLLAFLGVARRHQMTFTPWSTGAVPRSH